MSKQISEKGRSNKTVKKKRESKVEKQIEKGPQVMIGPTKMTRFEKARIIGARALQLACGAPPFVPLNHSIRDPIGLAIVELENKALPITIRRTLPNGIYQDIPIEDLL